MAKTNAVKKEAAPVIVKTAEQVQQEQLTDDTRTGTELLTKFGTKSAAIRELAFRQWETSRIAKALGIRYQHAYNVLQQPLKGNVVDKPTVAEVVDAVIADDKVKAAEAAKPVTKVPSPQTAPEGANLPAKTDGNKKD